MPNRQSSYVKDTRKVLTTMIESSKSQFYKVPTGYGMTAYDFDSRHENDEGIIVKSHDATEKMFRTRLKNEYFLERQLVKIIKSNKRGTFYSVTPLGIIYFCKMIEDFDNKLMENIFKHLRFFYEKGKPKSEYSYMNQLEQFWKIVSSKKWINYSVSTFKEIFDSIEMEYVDYTDLFLKYEFRNILVPFSEFIIDNSEEARSVISYVNMDKEASFLSLGMDISEEKINYLISKFIIRSFFHKMIDRMSSLHELLKIQPEKKYHKKAIQLDYEFSQIPEQFLEITDEFNDELIKIMKLHNVSLTRLSTQLINKKLEFKKS